MQRLRVAAELALGASEGLQRVVLAVEYAIGAHELQPARKVVSVAIEPCGKSLHHALDHGLTLARPHIFHRRHVGDARLAGKLRLCRFDARLDTQALMGERVRVFDMQEGWAWLQLEADFYVGYAALDDLVPAQSVPTHRVAVPSTFIFPAPDIKSQPAVTLTMNARVRVAGVDGRFAQLDNGRFVVTRHLKRLGESEFIYLRATADTIGEGLTERAIERGFALHGFVVDSAGRQFSARYQVPAGLFRHEQAPDVVETE